MPAVEGSVMRTGAIERLTDRQLQCLRLLYEHYKPGEIAGKLGISTDRVNQILKEARERLGVTRSIDAARMLAEAETKPPLGDHKMASQFMGDQELGVAPIPPVPHLEPSSGQETTGTPMAAFAEPHDRFGRDGATDQAAVFWPFPQEGRRINRLAWYHKLAWAILVALGATVLAGAMVSLQNAIH